MFLVCNEPLTFTKNKRNFKRLVDFCRLVSSQTNIYRHVFCYPQSYLLSLLYNSVSWSLYIAILRFGKRCVCYLLIYGQLLHFRSCSCLRKVFHHQTLSYLGTKDFLCKWVLVVFTAPGWSIRLFPACAMKASEVRICSEKAMCIYVPLGS